MGAYQEAVRELTERLLSFAFPGRERPRLLALHASSHHTSNTMALWAQVRARLSPRWEVEEIGLRNGTLSDCSGCPYTMCLHFGERGGCFYGGVMQEAVYPAVRQADGLILMCPNYNDALSANLSAFINRLTALFRQTRFYEKAVFALVVSGYSGSDTVARQLISSLNMNKSFYLPPALCHDGDGQRPRRGPGRTGDRVAAGPLCPGNGGNLRPLTRQKCPRLCQPRAFFDQMFRRCRRDRWPPHTGGGWVDCVTRA